MTDLKQARGKKTSASGERNLANYHPMSPDVRVDPYPYYQYLREHEPVKHLPDLNGYAVSRHADVQTVLLDHTLFSSDPLIQIAFGEFNPAPDGQ